MTHSIRFDYTEWRRQGLPDFALDELARLANLEADKNSRFLNIE